MSEQAKKVVLFDLPSRTPCKTWSPNPWKTRLLLNYKKIGYETRWIEYPDLTPVLSPHLTANAEGSSIAPYTIPTVILPDGTYVQESFEIAKRLDELYPSTPALQLESAILSTINDELLPKIMAAVAPENLYRTPTRLLTEVSAPWWFADRERRTGGKKLEVLQREKGGEVAAQSAAPHVKAVADLLREHPGGPFFEGDRVTYVDFVWVAFLLFMKRLGTDFLDLVIREDREIHLKLLDACQPWWERDDH